MAQTRQQPFASRAALQSYNRVSIFPASSCRVPRQPGQGEPQCCGRTSQGASRGPWSAGEQPTKQDLEPSRRAAGAVRSNGLVVPETQKKAPEPIALVGLECGVDDAGDDEERVPSKTFSHRMGPDSPWEPYPAHQCLVIEEAMRARPSGGSSLSSTCPSKSAGGRRPRRSLCCTRRHRACRVEPAGAVQWRSARRRCKRPDGETRQGR